MKQIIGRKIGMISLFESNGQMIAGTVVLCEPNVIVEKKNNSVNVGYFQISEKKLLKSKLGVFTKNSIQPRKYIKNLKTDNDYKIGDEINVDLFEVGEWVDVQGISKGHGFTGAIFRWNMKIGPMGHGAGYPHRWQGSIAQGRGGSSPQRVIKGKKMAGHYGHEKVTIQNLNVLYKDKEKNLIIIKGAIPGPKNSFVIIKEAIKPHKNKLNFDFNFNEIEKTIDVNHANVENN